MNSETDLKTLNELLEENQRLRAWIDDLQSGMYINCVYCGHRYGPKDEVPETKAQVLKDHIEICPKHPMSRLKKELASVNEKLQRTQKWLDEFKQATAKLEIESAIHRQELDFKNKVLEVIEGLRLLNKSEKDDIIYAFAHIGVGTCKSQHEDWHKELNECYDKLTEEGVIGERRSEGVLEQIEKSLDWCRKVYLDKKRRIERDKQ